MSDMNNHKWGCCFTKNHSYGSSPFFCGSVSVNDEKNGALYAQYKALADAEPGVIFGGRLGEYKYYDMDKVIEVALDVAAKELA